MRRLHLPLSGLSDVEVFSVGARSVQLLIRTGEASVLVRTGSREIAGEAHAGVAVVDVDGLSPDSDHRASIETNATGNPTVVAFRTRPEMGTVLTRFATISDIHLGLEEFGIGRKYRDSHAMPYSLRCARAAIEEARDWGAELLIVKGDLTEQGRQTDWDLAAQLFDGIDLPTMFTPGNHDVTRKQEVALPVGANIIGADHRPVHIRDLPGLRVVVADTSRDSRGTGDFSRVGDHILAAADTKLPVFLAFHHNIQRLPITWFWPPGISSTNATPVVRALAEVNAATFLSSGHTHRNRAHWLGPDRRIPYTEVSSTSDYPGVWAGYEISGTTIRQSVRRIASPLALSWTERTRSALGGVWPRWSQGRLHDRCVDFVLP